MTKEAIEKQRELNSNTYPVIYFWTDKSIDKFKNLIKIGMTNVNNVKRPPTLQEMTDACLKRINEYAGTSNLHIDLLAVKSGIRNGKAISDKSIHQILRRSGYQPISFNEHAREWFKISLSNALEAYDAALKGFQAINVPSDNHKTIHLRPEQNEAVFQTQKVFQTRKKMLWAAKPRFGKTITAYALIKTLGYQDVLVMSHQVSAFAEWLSDFKKMNMEDEYNFSSVRHGFTLKQVPDNGKGLIACYSFEDLVGSKSINKLHGVKDKNKEIFGHQWDLVIIDESQEGSVSPLAEKVKSAVIKADTRLLELSGTPYNIINDYDKKQIFTYSYADEQIARENFDKNHPDEPNPYNEMPKLNMLQIHLDKILPDYDYNITQLFDVNDSGGFIYRQAVFTFLTQIFSNPKYPLGTLNAKNRFRHIFMLLPSQAACDAMYKILMSPDIQKIANYYPIDVSGNSGKDDFIGTKSDLEMVRKAIKEHDRTIILSVRKLTVGVTIPELSMILFCNGTKSPISYIQASFRIQNKYVDDKYGIKTNAYIVDFLPKRTLEMLGWLSNANMEPNHIMSKEEVARVKEALKYINIIDMDSSSMKPMDYNEITEALYNEIANHDWNFGLGNEIYNENIVSKFQLDESSQKILSKIAKHVVSGNTKFSFGQDDLHIKSHKPVTPSKDKKKKTVFEAKKARQVAQNKAKLLATIRYLTAHLMFLMYGTAFTYSSAYKLIESVSNRDWQMDFPFVDQKDALELAPKIYNDRAFKVINDRLAAKFNRCAKFKPGKRYKIMLKMTKQFWSMDKETVFTSPKVVNLIFDLTLNNKKEA